MKSYFQWILPVVPHTSHATSRKRWAYALIFFFLFFLFLSLNDVVTQHKQKFYLVWNFEFVHFLQLLVLTFLLSPGGKRKGGAGPKIFRKNWRGNLPRRKLWLGIFKVAFMNSFQLFLILSFSLCVYKDL